ncbi:gp53-like domain-containing protein [Serratia marcescens]
MEVGAFGLGSGSRHRDDAYCNQAEIYRVNNTSKNAPGREVYGVLSLPCDGGPSGGYLAVQNNGDAFFGRSNIASNGVTWFQAYTTKFKPTAADVGALTDAQAAKKYALRSFKVNGKPLSGDVNLVAGDVNAWNKTEADARYVKRVGDDMTGPLKLLRLVFPSEVSIDGDNDLKRPDGFALEQLGDQSKNYPLTGGKLGNLITFKVNMYRNVQFAIGSGNTEFWLRSLREDSPQTARNWARVYTTDYKPSISDVKAADHSNNFAARMGVVRVLTGANKPTSPGPWSVENSSWTPVPWGSLYVSTNGTNLSTASGNGKFIHYLFIAHGTANKFYVATEVNGGFTGWESYLPRSGGQLSGAVKSSAEITAKYLSTPAGAVPEGSGAYAAQLNTKAPFYQENFDWDVTGGGHYVPLVKGRSNRKGQGYPTAVSFGYLLDGTPSFASPCIHVKADNAEAIWRFDPNNKQFVAPGNLIAGSAVYQNDGNINGTIWGGYLSNWLNNQFNARDNNINTRATWDYVNNRTHWWTDGERGWWKDENTGFIYQWTVGPWRKEDEQIDTVGFPMRFPNQCCTVNVGSQSQGGGNRNDATAVVYGWNQDNCQVQMNVPGESSWWNPMRAIIFAIGR